MVAFHSVDAAEWILSSTAYVLSHINTTMQLKKMFVIRGLSSTI